MSHIHIVHKYIAHNFIEMINTYAIVFFAINYNNISLKI